MNKIYRDKSIPMIAWCPAFSNLGIEPETQQPIILITYSPYLLKDLVELYEYISGRIDCY